MGVRGEDHFLCNKDIGLFSRDSENKAPMTQECETGGQRLGRGGFSEGGLQEALE